MLETFLSILRSFTVCKIFTQCIYLATLTVLSWDHHQTLCCQQWHCLHLVTRIPRDTGQSTPDTWHRRGSSHTTDQTPGCFPPDTGTEAGPGHRSRDCSQDTLAENIPPLTSLATHMNYSLMNQLTMTVTILSMISFLFYDLIFHFMNSSLLSVKQLLTDKICSSVHVHAWIQQNIRNILVLICNLRQMVGLRSIPVSGRN